MSFSERLFIGEQMWTVLVKEGEIYAILESKGVPNIAPFGKENDVSDHTTLTHMLRNNKWACWSIEMVLLVQYKISESRRSAFDLIQVLIGVRECNC